MPLTAVKSALCVGHPGHEMRVFEWMRRTQPLFDVLTDGSGPDRVSRFYLTENVAHRAGATRGIFRGAYSDRQFYDLILQKTPGPFLEMADRLAESWIAQEIELVAGDMQEGFNPTHEVCRMLINAAVKRVRRKTCRELVNLEFPLEQMRLPGRTPAVVVEITDEQFRMKRAAAEAYPALATEVDRLIQKHGETAFKVEMLVVADESAGLVWSGDEPPFYETYGRKQIASGHYRELITHEEHIRPLAEALYA